MIVKIPKIELHLHLDGALSPKTALELAKERHLSLGELSLEQLEDKMILRHCLGGLPEYLEKFQIPLAVLQDKEALERAAYELVSRLAGQGLIYSEIRFAPQLHTKCGCTQRQSMEGVIRGVRRAGRETGLKTGILLCAMTLTKVEDNIKENWETLELAEEYLGNGVCGMDIAGAEGIVPMEERRPLFSEAAKRGIPFTIHAGEVNIPENIHTALSFGAKRIGHGQSAIDSPAVLEEVIEKKIPLELCLTSNIQTNVRGSYIEHPLRRLYDAGAVVTMNTDNMVLSDVTLEEEYLRASSVFGFTAEDFCRMNRNSLEAAFLEEKEKEQLRGTYFSEFIQQDV